MKVGILGGTGSMGGGLALRWALKHDVLVGSRSLEKAIDVANQLDRVARGFYQGRMHGSVKGKINCDAILEADVVVVALPPAGIVETLAPIADCFRAGQVVVSTVVPMKKRNKVFTYDPIQTQKADKLQGRSAAEVIQGIVKPAAVVSAFQTVPATYLRDIESSMKVDVLMATDEKYAASVVSDLICDVANMRPLNVGGLANSALIEALTPLLLNVASLNSLKEPSIRIVPWTPTCFEKTGSGSSR